MSSASVAVAPRTIFAKRLRLPAFSIVASFMYTTTRWPPEKSNVAGTPFRP